MARPNKPDMYAELELSRSEMRVTAELLDAWANGKHLTKDKLRERVKALRARVEEIEELIVDSP